MMCFQVSRDCCQEKWKRDFTVCISSFCDDPRVLQTKSPFNLLFVLQLWLLTFLFQPLSLLGDTGMCMCWIENSGLEDCRWKPLGSMVSSRLLCLYHLFSGAGTQVPFHPTGFSKVWELCRRYNLSLRAQPTQSAEEPNYALALTSRHTLSHPPRPISCFPAGLLSRAVRWTSSVFPVGALLGVVTPPLAQNPVQLGCGEDVGQSSPLLDPWSAPAALPGTAGLWNPCLIHRQFFVESSCALGSALKSTKILPGNSLAELFPVNKFLPFTSAQNSP